MLSHRQTLDNIRPLLTINPLEVKRKLAEFETTVKIADLEMRARSSRLAASIQIKDASPSAVGLVVSSERRALDSYDKIYQLNKSAFQYGSSVTSIVEALQGLKDLGTPKTQRYIKNILKRYSPLIEAIKNQPTAQEMKEPAEEEKESQQELWEKIQVVFELQKQRSAELGKREELKSQQDEALKTLSEFAAENSSGLDELLVKPVAGGKSIAKHLVGEYTAAESDSDKKSRLALIKRVYKSLDCTVEKVQLLVEKTAKAQSVVEGGSAAAKRRRRQKEREQARIQAQASQIPVLEPILEPIPEQKVAPSQKPPLGPQISPQPKRPAWGPIRFPSMSMSALFQGARGLPKPKAQEATVESTTENAFALK